MCLDANNQGTTHGTKVDHLDLQRPGQPAVEPQLQRHHHRRAVRPVPGRDRRRHRQRRAGRAVDLQRPIQPAVDARLSGQQHPCGAAEPMLSGPAGPSRPPRRATGSGRSAETSGQSRCAGCGAWSGGGVGSGLVGGCGLVCGLKGMMTTFGQGLIARGSARQAVRSAACSGVHDPGSAGASSAAGWSAAASRCVSVRGGQATRLGVCWPREVVMDPPGQSKASQRRLRRRLRRGPRSGKGDHPRTLAAHFAAGVRRVAFPSHRRLTESHRSDGVKSTIWSVVGQTSDLTPSARRDWLRPPTRREDHTPESWSRPKPRHQFASRAESPAGRRRYERLKASQGPDRLGSGLRHARPRG